MGLPEELKKMLEENRQQLEKCEELKGVDDQYKEDQARGYKWIKHTVAELNRAKTNGCIELVWVDPFRVFMPIPIDAKLIEEVANNNRQVMHQLYLAALESAREKQKELNRIFDQIINDCEEKILDKGL